MVAAGARRMHAQTGPKIAWDESSGTTVNGYALTIDGVRTDYKLSPLSTTGTCGCSLALPFSGGRHTLVVSAYNASGEVASSPLTVAPIAAPGGPYTGQVGTAITVNGSGSKHPAGMIVGYTWSWGDGTNTAQLATSTASHSYSVAGTYQITLTVTDNAAATASATTTATISIVDANYRPLRRLSSGRATRRRRTSTARGHGKPILRRPAASHSGTRTRAPPRLRRHSPRRRTISSRRSTRRPECRITYGSGFARRTIPCRTIQFTCSSAIRPT